MAKYITPTLTITSNKYEASTNPGPTSSPQSISVTDKTMDIQKSIEKLCSYNIPNVIELKTKIADKIISENKYCF